MAKILPVILVAVLIYCTPAPKVNPQEIIDKAINAHGANLFSNKKVDFDFRDKHYSLDRRGVDVLYTRSFPDSMGMVQDVLVNSTDFSRKIGEKEIELSKEWKGRYGNSVNSVLYFLQLPYLLNDNAVNKKYIGKASIKGQSYHTIKVTFDREDGGVDHDDEFYYWFHEEDFTLDYLAYNYLTDGGGVRFREAFDRRTVGGIVFQDYINYKPDSKNTPLADLPGLFEEGKLKELSRIVNENIVVN